MNDIDYDSLSARLTAPDTELRLVGAPRGGPDSAAAGRALMLQEYGSDAALEAAMRPGRPGLGREKDGPSPAVRGRVTVEELAALKELQVRTGASQSALVRRAVHQLLVAERLVTA